jgi:hypothetical protein
MCSFCFGLASKLYVRQIWSLRTDSPVSQNFVMCCINRIYHFAMCCFCIFYKGCKVKGILYRAQYSILYISVPYRATGTSAPQIVPKPIRLVWLCDDGSYGRNMWQWVNVLYVYLDMQVDCFVKCVMSARYEKRWSKFITTFTKASYLSLFSATTTQFTPTYPVA